MDLNNCCCATQPGMPPWPLMSWAPSPCRPGRRQYLKLGLPGGHSQGQGAVHAGRRLVGGLARHLPGSHGAQLPTQPRMAARRGALGQLRAGDAPEGTRQCCGSGSGGRHCPAASGPAAGLPERPRRAGRGAGEEPQELGGISGHSWVVGAVAAAAVVVLLARLPDVPETPRV